MTWTVEPMLGSNQWYQVVKRNGETPADIIASGLTAEQAAQVAAAPALHDFVGKLAAGHLGHNIPAQDVLKRYGLGWPERLGEGPIVAPDIRDKKDAHGAVDLSA